MAERSDEESEEQDKAEVSRRKFLKWASYVPPTILGIAATAKPSYAATCNPNACNPDCNPNADCNPDKSCGPDGCNPDS
ncbi:MAG: hypothetical protein ABEK50_09985 [bacterium]